MFQNLKNKLSDKPKLKKVIIILKKIINALVYVFAIFMALLLTIGSSCSNSHAPLIYNKNEIQTKEIIQRDNYYIMGASERDSIESLYSIFNYATTINTYLNGWVNCDGQVRYINLVELGGNSNIDNIVYISNITSSTMPTIFNARRLRFYSTIVNAQNFRRWVYYIGFGNDGNNVEYGIQWNLFTDISNTTSVAERTEHIYNTNFRYSNDFNVDVSYLNSTDYAFTFSKNGTLALMYDSYIYSNDDAQYNSGYNIGLTQGYQVGYDDGYAQSQSDNTLDIFTIITQGFSAVSSLLNISLFPGLTLGTLIFLPTAIVVVIAIFHIFKG